MLKRLLGLLIVAVMCCISACPALAEDIVSANVEAEVLPAEWTGETGLVAEDGDVPGFDFDDEIEQGGVAVSPPEEAEPEAASGEEAAAGEGAQEQAADEEATAVEEAPVAATGLSLSASKLTIGLKEKSTALTATLLPENSTGTVTWRSGNTKIVKVDKKTGKLTGVKKGSATVYAKLSGGVEKKCKIEVKAAPKKVTLDDKKLTLSVGQSYKLKAALPKDTGSTLTYKSSKKKVAKISKSGKITPLKPGKTTITVKTFNGKKATCKLTVLAAPDQVILAESLTVVEGEHKTLKTSVLAANGSKTTASYTYSAENGTGAITVDARTGEVVGVKPGTAYVRVSTHNDVTTHLKGGERVESVCAVKVKVGPKKIELNKTSATIGVKQKFTLKPVIIGTDGKEMSSAKYTFTSSKPKKLSVTSKGVVKGLKKGTYTVTVKAVNGVTAKCTVKVVSAPSKVSLSTTKPVIGVGQTVKLKTGLPKDTAASFTYSSSDSKIVSVDKKGNVTGKKTGTATIKVKTHNSKSAKVKVTVAKGPEFITLNGDYELVYDALTSTYSALYSTSLKQGKTFRITYENEFKTYGDITEYKSLNPDVATVSDSGKVTAVAGGTAIIEVTSSSGAKARLQVTVSGTKPVTLDFSDAAAALQAGQSCAAPKLTGENISAKKLSEATYSSSDTGVFTVKWDKAEARWVLKGVKPGTATLTAKASGAKAKAKITVTAAKEAGSIAFEYDTVYMNVGDGYVPEVLDEFGKAVTVQLFSDDTGVVNVDENGRLVAMAEGDATVTANSGSLGASMTVKVRSTNATVTLSADEVKLGVGQRKTLKAKVNGDGASASLAFASSDSAVATVSKTGKVIARGVGTAVITATVDGGASDSCTVNVVPAPTHLSLEPASISKRLDVGGVQIKWAFGVSDEVGTVTFTSANTKIAEVSDKGYVSFKAVGETKVTAVTNNGLSATIDVTVLPKKPSTGTPSYRLFAAYGYADSNYSGYLPFPGNNAKSVAKVFGKSSVSGLEYSTKVMGNPTKDQLFSGIGSFFAKSADDDVSIVYICTHGKMTGDYTGYRMLLAGYTENPDNANYYMTAQEIFNSVKRIRGSVVLILDSCYSGTFLQDMGSMLKDEGGRIAVLTASSNTRATFYNIQDTNRAVDFFTFFMLQGLGYNERDGWWNSNAKGANGSYPGYLAADAAGNGDGIVTLSELFNYTSKCIAENIPSFMKQKWYWGDKTRVQVPRYYGGKLDDLVIYKPSK